MKYICFKQVNQTNEKKEIVRFPIGMNHDVVAEALSILKSNEHNEYQLIERQPVSAGFVDASLRCHGKSYGLQIAAAPEDSELMQEQSTNCHYICFVREGSLEEELVTFPTSIDHEVIANNFGQLKNAMHGSFEMIGRIPISAGQIDEHGVCFGNSETLKLHSREEDSEVLSNQLRLSA